MNDSTLLSTILLMGICFGILLNWFLENVTKHLIKLKEMAENNRLFKKKQAIVDKMKADGDFHEWITLPTVQGNMTVCKKTGWSPSVKGFVPIANINTFLENQKAEEEYKAYRSAKITSIALDADLSIGEVESIANQLFTMKKDFYVARIAKLQSEIETRAAAVKDGKN